MIETYKQQYLAQMTALRKESYRNRDMLQEALNLECEMFQLSSDGELKDKPRFSDVIARLSERDERVGGVATEEINELEKKLVPLGEMISTSLSGGSGERLTYNILKTLKCPNIILRNAELTADYMHCEIDLLVITPKTVFSIEVKNYKHDTLLDADGNLVKLADGKIYDCNLAERIRCREHILRTVLAQGADDEDVPPDIKTYVVYANPKVRFVNEFPFVESYCYSVIADIIDNQVLESTRADLDMNSVRQMILAAYDIHEYPLDVDVETIRSMFVDILAKIRYAEELSADAESTSIPQVEEPVVTIPAEKGQAGFIAWLNKTKNWFIESPVPRYAGSSLAGAFLGGYWMKFKLKRS